MLFTRDGYTADSGAFILGTWDLRYKNNRAGPLKTSGFGGFGVGGGVWWSSTNKNFEVIIPIPFVSLTIKPLEIVD